MRLGEANLGDFWSDPPPSLDEALVLAPDPLDLITRLARALCGSEVRRSKRPNGEVNFSAELPSQPVGIDLMLTSRNELRGVGIEQIKKVYAVVVAIENELSTAVYFGPEGRRKRVEAVCRRLNLSKEEFNNILRHWTKF